MQYTEVYNDIRNGFLSLFFPQQCRTCGRYIKDFSHEYVCSECFNRIEVINDPVCDICGKPLNSDVSTCIECIKRKNNFEFCRPAGIYKDALKDIIYSLKFDKKKKAAEVLADFICAQTSMESLEEDFVLVPVPANKTSEKERGFCHVSLIAEAVSKRTGHEVKRIVKKVKETEPQSRLDKKKRLTNLKNCFEADGSAKGGKFAIIDDVFTTGSTINEVAKTLKKAGAAEVIGIVAARSV